MSYGIAGKETRAVIASQVEHVAFEEGPYRLDVIVDGALDESFDFAAMDSAEVADAMADHLRATLGVLDWQVDVYESDGEPPDLLYKRTSDQEDE